MTKIIYSFMLTVALLTITGFVLAHFITFQTLSTDQILALLRPDMSPEWIKYGQQKLQHTIFITLTLLSPLYCLLAIRLCRKLPDSKTVVAIASIAFSWVVFYLYFNTQLFTNDSSVLFIHSVPDGYLPMFSVLFATIITLFGFICLYYINRRIVYWQRLFTHTSKWQKIVFILIVVIAILINAFPGHLYTGNFLTYYTGAVGDLDAVFYNVTQVVHGKTLLANLPSQYGLFAELLYPIFKVIGISMFKFSLITSILQMLALFAIATVAYRLTNSYTLTVLCTVLLCYIAGGTMFLANGGWANTSQYYQYWPIRTFFPAISVFAFWKLVQKITTKKIIAISVLAALALIWNFESGVAIVGGLLAYLVVQQIMHRNTLRYILVVISTVVGVLALFCLYLELKSGFTVDWHNALKYQQIFYNIGMAQIPIPKKLDVWCVCLAVYLFGILYALFKKNNTIFTACVLYISVLGTGLFTYYEYRAHILNLIAVCWPAILLWIVFTGKLFTTIKQRKLPIITALFGFPIVFLCLISVVMYIRLMPDIYAKAVALITIDSPAPNVQLGDTVLFIESELAGDKEAAFLLLGTSIYCSDLGITSAIDGPGEVELTLRSDYDAAVDQLIAHPVKHIFINPNDERLWRLLLSNKYYVAKKSNIGVLHLMPNLEAKNHD